MTTRATLPATAVQRNLIDSMRKQLRWPPDTMDEIATEITGHRVDSLTRGDASNLITYLQVRMKSMRAGAIMTTVAAHLDHILDTPHPDPFPPAVHAIAEAGYAANVADHPQPVPWAALDAMQRIRWLQAADFLAAYRGMPDAAGIRAVYFAGFADGTWAFLGPKSRLRWQRVTSAMLAAKVRVMP